MTDRPPLAGAETRDGTSGVKLAAVAAGDVFAIHTAAPAAGGSVAYSSPTGRCGLDDDGGHDPGLASQDDADRDGHHHGHP